MIYGEKIDTVYAGVHFFDSKFCVSIITKTNSFLACEESTTSMTATSGLISWLRQYMRTNQAKIIALGVSGKTPKSTLFSHLWLDLDIVPVRVKGLKGKGEDISKRAAEIALSNFNSDNSHSAKVMKKGKVAISELIKLTDYEKITPPEEFQFLLKQARNFEGKSMAFISATPQGGGVALMRHALIRLSKLLNTNLAWYVLKDDPNIFNITKKKFHNVLQAVADESVFLTEQEKEYFLKWSKLNARKLENVFKKYDCIVIDDPQPAGLIPYIKRVSPKTKIIYRSHIQLVAKLADTKGTSQNNTWQFLWQFIKEADVFISHPLEEFVPKEVDFKKLIYAPATTDPLDGLNKELTDEQKDYYTKLFNDFLIKDGQSALDPTKPFIAQIARFDPSKGIPDLLKMYALLHKKLKTKKAIVPQLVIAGNGSVDDPDGVPILNYVMESITKGEYKHLKDDIKVLRLPHYDQLLNTIVRKCHVLLQLSYKEGFEIKISEGLMKGKPVVVYDSGGMKVQIEEGITGYTITEGNYKEAAKTLIKLFSDDALYTKLGNNAARLLSPDVLTISSVGSWLWLANYLIANKKISFDGKYIKNLTGQSNFDEPHLKVIKKGR